jgi:tetratricopeptide (TPR) repeat protein
MAGDISEAINDPFTITHPDTASLIVERVGTRPLFLEQALQYAADLGGLGLSGGRLYIADIQRFHAAIDGLPGRIRELIAKRWAFIHKRLQAEAVLLVQSLVELISMPLLVATHLGIRHVDIHTLVNLGIVDITESNEVRFHHRQHYLFFADLYREIIPDFAHQLLKAIEAAGYSDAYPFQGVILRETIGELLAEDLQKIAVIIVDKSITGLAQQRATPLLLDIFNRSDVTVDPGTELRVVNTLCQELKRHVAFETAATAFDHAYILRLPRRTRYLDYGEEYSDFLHDHVNSFFALHRDGEALTLLESSLHDLVQFRFKTEDARQLAQGKLLNRLSVALKTINDVAAAERSVCESLAIAQTLHDIRLTYKNYIDWGYIYHGFNRYNDELIEKWSAALEVFRNNLTTDPEIHKERASAFLHSSELEILGGRQSAAIKIIEEGIRYSRRTLTPFHEVKLLLLRVVAELAWDGNAEPKSLMRWVNMAEDRAVATRAQRSYWVVLYTRAKLYRMANDYGKATSSFLSALEQIAKILTDSRMEERYEPFFEDLALHLRMAGQMMSKQDMRRIRNARIRQGVGSILEMDSSAFADWLSSYAPTSTFHDGHHNLPVP